jgi:diguanylate cyclase (GGDEF)-like protein/PAS domain S-box-containing protein
MPAHAHAERQPFDPARLLDVLPGAVAYVDRRLRYRYANAAYGRRLGLDPVRIAGMRVRDVVGRQEETAVAASIERALRGEATVRDSTSYTPDRDGSGGICGVVVHVAYPALAGPPADDTAPLHDDAFLHMPIAMAEIGIDGRLARVNDAFARMLGQDAEALVGRRVRDLIHPDDMGRDSQNFVEMLQGRRDGYRAEKRYVRADGGVAHAALAISVLRNPAGEASRFVVQVEDVTDARLAEAALARSNARLALAIEATRGGLWHIDVAERRFECSTQLARLLTGGEKDTLDVDEMSAMVDERDPDRVSFLALVEGKADRKTIEYRAATPFGRRLLVCDARLLRDEAGKPVEVVGLVRDVTEERARQRAVELQADTDPLTSLLNRRGLERRIDALRAPAPLGVVLVDLDRFKLVNDTHGHDAGDAVLVETAARLRALVRNRDLVARLGGDEFLIALPGVDEEVLAQVAERVCKALARGFGTGEDAYAIGGTVGAALRRSADMPFAATVADADRALYRIKAADPGWWALAD